MGCDPSDSEAPNHPGQNAVYPELADEAATLGFGEDFAKHLVTKLPRGGLVFLHGDLGAGKTTLTRGIIRSLGFEGAVKSPTYTLIERYPTQPLQVCHFDLYRMNHPEELEFIGARDDLVEGNLCLIEWPERGAGWLKKPDVELYLRFNYLKNNLQLINITRQIEIRWHNAEV